MSTNYASINSRASLSQRGWCVHQIRQAAMIVRLISNAELATGIKVGFHLTEGDHHFVLNSVFVGRVEWVEPPHDCYGGLSLSLFRFCFISCLFYNNWSVSRFLIGWFSWSIRGQTCGQTHKMRDCVSKNCVRWNKIQFLVRIFPRFAALVLLL